MSSRRLSSDRQYEYSMPMDVDDEYDDNLSQTSQNSDVESDIDEFDSSTAAAALDPLLSAIDDLEGRIITALDNFKLHPGVKSSSNSNSVNSLNSNFESIHVELKETLRPVLEIAAHVGPATARNKWRQSSSVAINTIDAAIEEVYKRLNSDLILPVLLESAQSDAIPAKRAASLSFFHSLYNEYKMAGSYLDYVESGPGERGVGTRMGVMKGLGGANIGYSGSLYGTVDRNDRSNMNIGMGIPSRAILRQRSQKKSEKSIELLRYWVEASTSCTTPGSFSNVHSDGSIASRAVISASAVIRPALRHVAEKIASADDAGALKLFIPVMRMIGGVLRRLFAPFAQNQNQDKSALISEIASADALRSACIKFLEIVVLCFSTKAQTKAQALGAGAGAKKTFRQQQQQGGPSSSSTDDFALDDLPMGHHIITREALEEIGEDAFTVLRGLTTIGGQVKVDPSVARDVMLSVGLDANGT